ncbi:MAG: DUF2231 domain-containing protein [Planctomycetota bacterium]
MDWLFPGLAAVSNSHPLWVHFPIAFWLGALLFCVCGLSSPDSGSFRTGRWLLHLGTLAGIGAVVSGYFATAGMDHEAPAHEVIHVHRNFMIVAAALSVAASVAMFLLRHDGRRGLRFAQVVMLAVVSGVAALGADRGALLVYGHGIAVHTGPQPAAPEGDHGAPATHTHERK